MISKAAGLSQTKNKMRFKFKLSSLIFVLMVNSTALQAETYMCQTNSGWLKKWYNISFFEVDITRGFARFGTNEKWLDSYKVRSQKAGIGMIYSWKQDLVVTNDGYIGRTYSFKNKLRIRKDGRYDLMMGRPGKSWEIKATCKIN